MKWCSRVIVSGALPVLMVAAAAVTSLAADSPWQSVKVPFAFRAGIVAEAGQLAPGTYRILSRTKDGETVIKLEGPSGETEVPVSTRLARTKASGPDANLVFDTVDGMRTLAEVWLPGEDGYLVRGNLAEKGHEHVILSGSESN